MLLCYALDGNLVDCTSTTDECFDFTGLDFGVCAMVLGVGLLNDECSYISGCDWTINNIDYSDLFFDGIDECDEQCTNDTICDEIEENYLELHFQKFSFVELQPAQVYLLEKKPLNILFFLVD